MIRNADTFREWENNWISLNPLSLQKKFQILNGMYQEARALGVFPPKDPMEGLEIKIKVARILNVRKDP